MKTFKEIKGLTASLTEDEAIRLLDAESNGVLFHYMFKEDNSSLVEVNERNGKFYVSVCCGDCPEEVKHLDLRLEIEGDSRINAVEKAYQFIYEDYQEKYGFLTSDY